MGCTLDGATPDNKAVERGKLDARGRGGIEGWDRGRVRERERERREETSERDRDFQKGSGMETESRGLLNVDLWVLRSPGLSMAATGP